MKYFTIYSRWLPLGKESNAMAVWPFVIIKKSRRQYITPGVKRHEEIHLAQQRELLFVGFFLLYAVFFLFGWIRWRSWKYAYEAVPFEQEAYINQVYKDYLSSRKWFAWTEYV